jgi:transcriptional regulator with XRE-family HTH domain
VGGDHLGETRGRRTGPITASPTTVSLAELGGRLRTIRRQNDYSLGVVAQRTGLSASFLSLVENGKSDISLGRLVRLMDFYGVTLSGMVDPRPGRARVVVRRAEQRSHLVAGGVRTEFLAESLGAPVSHLLMTFEPAASIDLDENEEFSSPLADESFYLVMQGELLVELAGREAVVLTEGDSITLRHQDFRRSRNVSPRRTVVYVSRVYTSPAHGEAPAQQELAADEGP